MKVSIKILLCSSTPHRFQIIQPSQLEMSLVGNITNLGNETIIQVCVVLVNVLYIFELVVIFDNILLKLHPSFLAKYAIHYDVKKHD